MNSTAARTNLSSSSVRVNRNIELGQGQFRIAYAGTYVGGNRNSQEAVCKVFKPQYRVLENEFYETDFKVAARAIQYAEDWNNMCEYGKEILITCGSIMVVNDRRYLVEPLIRYFEKYTSNNGWIASVGDAGWEVEAMEAFSHYTYHRSGGQMIVCDLQGRYRYNRFNRGKCRFELTDVAICSRRRNYGITDLGEKGIESFFCNHSCNGFCHSDGNRWARPRSPNQWFVKSSGTSMMGSSFTNLLSTRNRMAFDRQLRPVHEIQNYSDSDDDSWYPWLCPTCKYCSWKKPCKALCVGRVTETILFVECGFGSDAHGQNSTKAAVRACRNAIEFNQIPSIGRLIPGGKDEMKLDVLVAVPAVYQADLDVEAIKAAFPYGQVRVQIQDGGMIANSGIAIEAMGDKNTDMIVVCVAVTVGY